MNNYNNAFKINAFQNFKTHLIVCENIFEDPSQIRNHALQEYTYSTRKAYGYVCNWGIVSNDILSLFTRLLKMDIDLKAYHFLFIPIGLKQFPHVDEKPASEACKMCIASVVYLNPDIDKKNYTAFYENFIENNYDIKPHLCTSFVGNRYNKCILYDGSIYHSPGSGFGNDLGKPQDIRLAATYFIDAVDRITK